MPAKSRSQQRLFGMVHAYNKGEFHGSLSLRKRIEGIASRISDEDAAHFAKTQHSGLPEVKKAQYTFTPEQMQAMTSHIPYEEYADGIRRSRKRRSLLGKVIAGTLAGTAVGGLGMGGLGWYLAGKSSDGHLKLDEESAKRHKINAGTHFGLWGAGRGALVGGLTGLGLGILDKIRGD